MPVFLFCRDMGDVAHANNLLARFGSDDTLAGGDEEHLITAVGMHLVSSAGAEVHDGKIKILTRLGRQQRLPGYLTTREQGTIRWLGGNLLGLKYFHGASSFQFFGLLQPLRLILTILKLASP
jgi:hypothetical protein